MSLQAAQPADIWQGDVRGHVLDMDELHSSIPFASTSDALFTSLFSKYKNTVLMKFFDDLLALFQHPEFRSDRVTLRGVFDLFDHIASQRQIIARSRNEKRTCGQLSNDCHPTQHHHMPTFVLELVAEYLDSHRKPFHHTLHVIDISEHHARITGGCDVTRMLAKMSLVHRSWADVSQRFLRRRIQVLLNERDGLQPILLHPQLGPWVRELSVVSGSATDDIFADSAWTEIPRSLCRVLQRCPTITYLHLDGLDLGVQCDESQQPSYDVLGQIASLTCLEHLCLLRAPKATQYDGFLKKLCAILPGLRYLKSLVLEFKDEWGPHNEGLEPAATSLSDAPSPPTTLTFLSLIKFNIFNSGIWRWLLNPDGDNWIRSLELSCDDISRSNRQTGASMNITPGPSLGNAMTEHIASLQLLRCSSESDLGFIKDSFPSLQSLSLCFDSDWQLTQSIPRAENDELPKSVRNLYIYFGSPPSYD